MYVDGVCSGQTDGGLPAGFQTVSHCLGCGPLQLDICWREKSVTQTTRFTVDEGEINKTKQILMVQTVLAQFKVCQACDHHAKRLSYRVKTNTEQLFRYGLEVEKRKPCSLVVWSEEVFQFEDGLQDMLAGHIGLISMLSVVEE